MVAVDVDVSVCVSVSHALPGPDADVMCTENKDQQSAFRALVRACRVRALTVCGMVDAL